MGTTGAYAMFRTAAAQCGTPIVGRYRTLSTAQHPQPLDSTASLSRPHRRGGLAAARSSWQFRPMLEQHATFRTHVRLHSLPGASPTSRAAAYSCSGRYRAIGWSATSGPRTPERGSVLPANVEEIREVNSLIRRRREPARPQSEEWISRWRMSLAGTASCTLGEGIQGPSFALPRPKLVAVLPTGHATKGGTAGCAHIWGSRR